MSLFEIEYNGPPIARPIFKLWCKIFGHDWRQTVRGVGGRAAKFPEGVTFYGRQCKRPTCYKSQECPCLGCTRIVDKWAKEWAAVHPVTDVTLQGSYEEYSKNGPSTSRA